LSIVKGKGQLVDKNRKGDSHDRAVEHKHGQASDKNP
jgi:hypothetical protein